MKDLLKEKLPGISGSTLKTYALITMIIDHLGAVFFPQYRILRCIGRLSFPVYCFLLAEGVRHTSDMRKYLLRLALFAVISEPCFDMAFHRTLWYPASQNVFCTLFLGALSCAALKKYKGKIWPLGVIFLCTVIAQVCNTDYHGGGVLIIVIMYLISDRIPVAAAGTALVELAWYSQIELYSLFSFLPLYLYNGKRGRQMKYLFYVAYPVHLMAFGLIRKYLL